MENPLSLWHFYLRNKRKVLPVIGILALAILGVVVTDSLLASARETAYATYGSYQKLILVAPRATREQDLANPLATLLSVSMMLRYSFGLHDDADLIDKAAQTVLAAGIRTGDIATPGTTKVSTTGMGDAMLKAFDRLAGA